MNVNTKELLPRWFFGILGVMMVFAISSTIPICAEDMPSIQQNQLEAKEPIEVPDASELKEEHKPMENVPIALVAPSGYATPTSRYEKGVAALEERGFKVTSYYRPEQHYQRFSGTDAERLHQIREAYKNPDVKLVMAVRGGYGASRLLKNLDFKQMAESGKVFVGYSDITVIHMGLLKHGAVSFAGPMVSSDYGEDDPSSYTLEHFEHVLTHPTTTIEWRAAGNPDVDVSGTFWGGNLAMMSHLVGTPWLPDIEGGILFLEDVSEHPYRIERMLLQMDEAGILRKQKALVLGHFTDYRLYDEDNGYSFDTVLAWFRKRCPIPVIVGLPFGHTKEKVTLPVGAKGHLQSHGGKVTLDLSGYPTVKP